LVVAAVVLPQGRSGEVPGLADSKLLTEKAREAAYDEVVRRALAWSVIVVPPQEVDRQGLHVMNVRAMRQAVWRLPVCPSYVLTDGFPISGLPAPALAVWKGDRVAACVAAASVVAKDTRVRFLRRAADAFPGWDFADNVGYSSPQHRDAITRIGICSLHRLSFASTAYSQLELDSA
jgi:ribonuclease HII